MFKYVIKNKQKNYGPFYGWGSTVSKVQIHYEEIVYFTTKFPEDPGTHFIDLGRMKGFFQFSNLLVKFYLFKETGH